LPPLLEPDPPPPASPKALPLDLTQPLFQYLDKEMPLLAGFLEHASRWVWTEDSVRIFFAPSRESARTDLESRRPQLSKAVQEALGKPMDILLLKLDPTDEDAAEEARKDDYTMLHEKLRLEAAQEPLVQRIMDRFKAHVVEVEKLEKA